MTVHPGARPWGPNGEPVNPPAEGDDQARCWNLLLAPVWGEGGTQCVLFNGHPSEHRFSVERDPDTLDAAWAQAEAALPTGWLIEGLLQFPIGTWEATAEPASDGRWAPEEGAVVQVEGRTPAGALEALAAALRREDET